jgi:hypothetical protein
MQGFMFDVQPSMLTARMGGVLVFWSSLLLFMLERFGFRVKGLG